MNETATKLRLPDISASIYINAPRERVWETLTTAEGWNAWFTDDCAIDLRPGGKIQLTWRDWSVERVSLDDGGPILELVPLERFSFQWHGQSRATTVSFWLEEHSGGTILKVCDSGYDFSEISEPCGFLDCAVGWGQAVTLLKFYLEHGVRYQKMPD